MYKIITDSSWDMNELAKELEVEVVPFQINLDGTGSSYQKEYIDITAEEIFQFMIDHPGVYPKSAQPSMDDYYHAFKKVADEGNDIICFTLSSKLTGSINSALNVKAMVEEEYPNIKIEVIDSYTATVMQGLLVYEIARYRQSGASYEDAIKRAKAMISTSRIFFTVDTLDYLIAGGRVGKVAGMSANLLNLKPMIILQDGELHSLGVARGRKPSISRAIKELIKYIEENKINIKNYTFITGYGYNKEEGISIQQKLMIALQEIDPTFNEEIPLAHIGGLIGAYTGPYPVGLGIVEKAKLPD